MWEENEMCPHRHFSHPCVVFWMFKRERERELFVEEETRAPVAKATLPRNWGAPAEVFSELELPFCFRATEA